MIELILSALLSVFSLPQPETAKVKPCVFPNRCGQQMIVKVKPCVFPNRCGAGSSRIDFIDG